MSSAPLQLEHSFYPEVWIKADPEAPLDNEEVEVDVGVHIAHHEKDEMRWQVSLSVNVGVEDARSQYRIKLQSIGFFRVHEPAESMPETAAMVAVNGGGMLYSAAREYLHLLTSRGPYGGYSLPTINPRDLPSGSPPGASPLVEAIVTYLREHGPARSEELAQALNAKIHAIRGALRDLKEFKRIIQERRGRQIYYQLAGLEEESGKEL